jgi:hypothetical protein
MNYSQPSRAEVVIRGISGGLGGKWSLIELLTVNAQDAIRLLVFNFRYSHKKGSWGFI